MTLLSLQRYHRIHAGGAAGGDETGGGGDQGEEAGNGQVNGWVERLHFEQDGLQRPGRDYAEQQSGATGAQNETDGELPRSLLHDHPENPLRVRAQGHANAEFLSALMNNLNFNAI